MYKISTYMLIMSFVLFPGCVKPQKLDHTPVENTAFNKPLSQLKAEYSDIELYESTWRGFPSKTPDYDDLTNKWGAAQENEYLWGRHLLAFTLNGVFAVGVSSLPVSWFIAIEAIITPLPQESHT